MINGKIIKGIGGFYYVDTEKGLYECRARGIFRKNKITPLVGDRVSISVVDEENKKGVVEEIEKRDTELVRPPIANVDKALIVFAIKNPAPNLSLLDRFIVLAEKENLEIVIVFTKVDLDADGELLEELKSIYEVSGYKVIPVSNKLKLNIDKIKEDLNENEVNILIGHGYVTMKREEAIDVSDHKYEAAELETSESERPLSIGGTDLIDGNIFKDFDYVALGHLHGRQKIGRETMRYSGSLLKYSFSEVKQKKSVAVLDLKDKDINIELRELNPFRDLRIIKGNIEDLICEGRDVEEGKEDYIQAILTDDGELMNPMEKLKAVYPNTMLITRERKRNVSEDGAVAKGEFRKKSKME